MTAVWLLSNTPLLRSKAAAAAAAVVVVAAVAFTATWDTPLTIAAMASSSIKDGKRTVQEVVDDPALVLIDRLRFATAVLITRCIIPSSADVISKLTWLFCRPDATNTMLGVGRPLGPVIREGPTLGAPPASDWVSGEMLAGFG